MITYFNKELKSHQKTEKATSLNLQTALLCIFIALMALVFLATVSRSMLKHSY